MIDLFEVKKGRPLAWRMRPNDIRDIVGQGHLLDEGRTLRNLIESDSIVSIIFYGPPGTGKAALAQIIAKKTTAKFYQLNAVTSGIKDIRDAVTFSRSQRTILFIDEIHRFNKIQQDALLPHIENGEIILIGASTENPFFALIPALSSRTIIFKFNHLSDQDIISVLKRAIYVAASPKSNASYMAIDRAIEAVNNQPLQLVPAHLRGSNYSGASILGAGGYKYPHDYPRHYVDQEYLINKIQFYHPTQEGFEQVIGNV